MELIQCLLIFLSSVWGILVWLVTQGPSVAIDDCECLAGMESEDYAREIHVSKTAQNAVGKSVRRKKERSKLPAPETGDVCLQLKGSRSGAPGREI